MTQSSLLTTRPLNHSDFAAWFSLLNRYLHRSGGAMAWTQRAALFRQLTGSDRDAAALVVEYAGKIVGFAHCRIDHAGSGCQIQDLFVIPAFQAMRAGTALMQAVYRTAEALHATAVYWSPAPQHDSTLRAASSLQMQRAA
jgi:GNAT superfamily N-acetyltransferase